MEDDKVISQSHFSMLENKVDGRILQSLKTMGLAKPTKIQAITLPHMLLGEDIIGAARTGSGKTLAFLIPAADRLLKLEFIRNHGM